jgi:RimJ/RimL family protein N-acetyltransferase
VIRLAGRFVTLEPLSLAHLDGLVAAAAESRATYGLTHVPDTRAAMRAYIEAALASPAVPFATVAADGRVVGSTRFGNLEHWSWPEGPRPDGSPDAVEIGWTWLAASAQRSAINSEAKLLMLGHAFEDWRVHRVTLKTDARNQRSRAAIERLGARLDGVLRAHMPAADGGVRDSAVYSILAAEWPAARARLVARLDRG